MRKYTVFVFLTFFAFVSGNAAENDTEDRPLFVLDEQHWIVFYDLPSRRFRTIRSAYMRGELEQAEADLQSSIAFFAIEAARASEALEGPLQQVVADLTSLVDEVRDRSVALGRLDQSFGRAHWLLAQHFLDLATVSRDAERHRNAASYLQATAHHLERTVLWSNAVVDNRTLNALDGMRSIAAELARTKDAKRVYRERPLANARRTIERLGDHIDRAVLIRPLG